eukprot:CAMPEP_0196572208 /NCGR_PEP_ID=MMETSP1081-20130531/2291_1 /TAXON_ID=36882 /ORGANISM="Pyramimonas amylifera, Strain CCMP720" /LENGTH=392 /DNA_ID=CAMNT_0041889441 /DNA_START=70 /DNA_END=1248 /DNA_ORIENTATION=+
MAGNYVDIPKARYADLIKCEALTMAQQPATGLTVKELLQFGSKTICLERMLHSAEFLHSELPIRYARRTMALESSPDWMLTPNLTRVRDMYFQSFQDLRSWKLHQDAEGLKKFNEYLNMLKIRQAGVVPQMGGLVMDLRQRGALCDESRKKYLNESFDKFFKARISTELLVGQHLALCQLLHPPEGQKMDEDFTDRWVGLVQKQCFPAQVVEDAAMHAAALCERQFGKAPDLQMEGELDVSFSYFPDQLYYIAFEILKNAMRATTERHAHKEDLPPVRVVFSRGKGDQGKSNVAIMIQDEGGGIPHKILDKVWEYSFTTVKHEDDFHDKLGKQHAGTGFYQVNAGDSRADPLAGLGFGLPLSRLYARSFGGDLTLMSLEGWGTSAYLHFFNN